MELKACPLCGKPLIVRKSIVGGEEHYVAYCHCGFEFADDCILEDFIKKCNRRAATENKAMTVEQQEFEKHVYCKTCQHYERYADEEERKQEMKSTGIVRRIDELGRVVIPKELRDTLVLPEGTPMEILAGAGEIVLRKYQPPEMTDVAALLAALQLACQETGKDPMDYLNAVREGRKDE